MFVRKIHKNPLALCFIGHDVQSHKFKLHLQCRRKHALLPKRPLSLGTTSDCGSNSNSDGATSFSLTLVVS